MTDPAPRTIPRWRTWLVAVISGLWIRATRWTMRITYRRPERLKQVQAEGRHIVAFWHNRMFLMIYASRDRRFTVLISRHQDGEYVARTMEHLGLHCTRGSTTRGGAAALRALVRRMRRGWNLAITPDGPQGPRYVVQPGVLLAARLSGAPILPVAFASAKKKPSTRGTGLRFPCPSPGASSSTGSPSGCRPTAPGRPWKRRAGSWKTACAR